MNTLDAIEKRHSYRGPFKDTPVPRGDLRRIMQAALQAPSGCNKQTTHFVVIDDAGLVQKIRQMHPNNQAMCTAQAYIIGLIDQNPPPAYATYHFQAEDCAAAVQNMLLAITDLGYATVWIDGWLRIEGHADAIGQLLDLPPEKVVRIILPVGVPAEALKPREKKSFEERVWFNRYGASPE